MEEMNPNQIETRPPFSDLFQIRPELLQRIEQDMRDNSYDFSEPIILATWPGQEKPVCIDGHTKRQAAINVGIEAVPVWTREDFETEDEALEYTIKRQRNRRNMTDAEILACVAKLDNRQPRGGDRKTGHGNFKPQDCGKAGGRSAFAKEVAEIVGINARKVEQTFTVIDHAEPDIAEAVRNNEMSINKAYTETQKKRKDAQRKESKSDSRPEDPQIQLNVAEPEPRDEPEPQQQSTADSEADNDENDGETDPAEAGPPEDEEAGTGHAVRTDAEGYVSIKIPTAQYEALSQYDWTVEEMVEEAIALYLERLEQEQELDRAEYEERWASDEEDEGSDVEAA